MKRIVAVGMISTVLSLSACKTWWSDKEEDNNPYKDRTAKQLYNEATTTLAKKEYSGAIQRLEALETMYPFNTHAEQAEIDLIYAYYKKGDYISAAANAERFIHLYPRAKQIDYAYYMKALANFQQNRGTLVNLLPIDESMRDPGSQLQAYSDFSTLVQLFPESKYKADALRRMIYLRNVFARRELHAANYYFTRKMYVAAAERASDVVKMYPQSPSAQNALALLYYANVAMGLHQAAHEAKRVYEATYGSLPNSSAIKMKGM